MRLFGLIMRKDAREAVLILLYGDLFVDKRDSAETDKFLAEKKLSDSEKLFAKNLYGTINENKDYLLSIIGEIAQGFNLNRIFPTDKCALLIGMCEMTYFPDVPKIVAIDEAVNLSMKYSTEKSSDFVNGILAEYKKRLESAAE